MSEKKKIFQPKIIIGSILGFVSAAVGTVAVFFPSLLNLELERMPKYDSGEYSSMAVGDDYRHFIKFLGDRIKDEKLFEVGLHLPLGGKGQSPIMIMETTEELFKKGIAFSEDDKYVCIIATGDKEVAAEIGADPENVERFGVEFSEVGASVSDILELNVVGASEFCFPHEMIDIYGSLSGYAYYDADESFSLGGNFTHIFKAVDKTAVKLKKY